MMVAQLTEMHMDEQRWFLNEYLVDQDVDGSLFLFFPLQF